ncbi:MAG: hypothetical protein DMF11_10835 [Verrucomicrobia bacterium]|nr:MAG: hypothetical protein DMF11_10835 [Verrucomicrobiota bacterium]PYK48820.1 MAG: hypothetical protein DME51_10325 [Verrucomicrobiota bacterium]
MLCRFSLYPALPRKGNRKDNHIDPWVGQPAELLTARHQARAYASGGRHFLQKLGKISSATPSAGCG